MISIHFFTMTQPQSSTIYVADLPVNKEANPPQSAIDEEFLRQLFQDQGVSNSPEAVTIKTKIGRSGNPYAFAFIKFDTHDQAVKAIADLNYTKLDNVPIRLILADKETKNITRSNQGNLFIKNLDPDIEVSQLHDAFANFGEIISCKIPSDLVTKDGEKKYVSRGYGYVQFRNPDDAKQAMTDLKDASINGRPVEIQPFCRRQHQNPENTFVNCYIKNFPESFKDSDLKQLFEEYGTPVSCKIMVDDNGKSKQFGFCSMSTHDEALKATENLNGREIEGLTISCGRAMTKAERQKEIEKQSEKWRRANYEKYKGRNLYVRNFDENVNDEELKEIFSQFGELESVKVMRDKDGNSRKFGFVCYQTPEQAEDCIQKSTLILIHDKQAYVALAMSREQRQKTNIVKQNQRRAANAQVNNAQNQMPMYGGQFPMNPPMMPNAANVNIPFPPQNAQNLPAMPFNPMPSGMQPPQQGMPFPQGHPENQNPQFNPMQFAPPGVMPFEQPFNPMAFANAPMYNQDNKAMLRSEILEKHSNNTVLLQRLRDMSEEQAKELANNQQLFVQWLEQA